MRLGFSMERSKNATYSHKPTSLLSCSRIQTFVKLYTTDTLYRISIVNYNFFILQSWKHSLHQEQNTFL